MFLFSHIRILESSKYIPIEAWEIFMWFKSVWNLCIDTDDKGRGFNLGISYQKLIYFQELHASITDKF